jgi:hypothetical protein
LEALGKWIYQARVNALKENLSKNEIKLAYQVSPGSHQLIISCGQPKLLLQQLKVMFL